MVKNRKTIHSWLAFVLGLGSTVAAGFFKVLLSSYPHEAVIGGIVGITIAYLGKRVWQKHKSFNNYDYQNTECE